MNRYVVPAALVAVGALALPGAATAAPKLSAKPSFSGSRLVVTVTSGKKFTARTRPRALKVAAGAATYKLEQGARSARKSTWRSGALSAAQLGGLYAAKVRITVRTPPGRSSRRAPPRPPPDRPPRARRRPARDPPAAARPRPPLPA